MSNTDPFSMTDVPGEPFTSKITVLKLLDVGSLAIVFTSSPASLYTPSVIKYGNGIGVGVIVGVAVLVGVAVNVGVAVKVNVGVLVIV